MQKKRGRRAAAPADPPEKKVVPARLNAFGLAAHLGVSQTAISYHVARGNLSGPGPDQKYDVARAKAEWLARLDKTRMGPTIKEPDWKRATRGASTDPSIDATGNAIHPDLRFRLAKAEQEEIKVKKMRGDSWDAKTGERRVFALIRLIRDRVRGFVAKSAPAIAARVTVIEGRVQEGSLWREMNEEVRKLLDDLATIDIKKALTSDMLDPEDEEEREESAVEPEEPPEKRKPGRPKSGLTP